MVDQIVFYLFAWLILPCLRLSDPIAKVILWLGLSVREVPEAELERNYWIIKVICFLASNAVVYALNVLYVFETGRHSKPIEMLLFLGSSLLQFFFIWLGGLLITEFGWEVTYSNVTMLVASMLVNFTIRKNLVFRG